MFKKICSSPEGTITTQAIEHVFADESIVDRFTKLAKDIKAISAKSDDFLYFSIIFLKSAESAVLDDYGKIKKLANGEDAWGFFDENWKWHGNIKPHRNNNRDIFPESELKIAAAKWVGMPLCRDHESSSVDGIRGIILDAHYDEKFKQVVGLCALDKVNYPDLARKVQTGVVRYGSMGTAVETSVCSECGNKAATQKEYCNHVLSRTAHGEINVGLKPIEYSLVVQPAEPGAILLKCIASLETYRDEFVNNGVDDVDQMLGKLSLQQAQHLEGIMKTACGEDGCSIPKRQKIIRSFLENNGLSKIAEQRPSLDEVRYTGNLADATTDAAKALVNPDIPSEAKEAIRAALEQVSQLTRGQGEVEGFTSKDLGQSSEGIKPVSSTERTLSGVTGENLRVDPAFPTREDGDVFAKAPSGELAATASTYNFNLKTSKPKTNLTNLVEEIMSESGLRKRAELRRRIAYMQGGAEGEREPSTFKSEKFPWTEDKQMHQDAQMGGDSGMFPGDADVKGKLSRAQLEERRLKRLAYMQGGADGEREPSTFKSEKFPWTEDKQMHQDKGMGGDSGMFPGDADVKGKLSRAKAQQGGLRKQAYNGPALSTRFTVKKTSNGLIDKRASLFEVFSGEKRVIVASAGEIFGRDLSANWDWIRSREYGQEVCKQIRASGLNHVAGLLKNAQELPALDVGAAMPPAMPAPMDAGAAMPPAMPAPEAAPEEKEEEESPAEAIDNRIADIQRALEEIKTYVDKLQDESTADVDVNVFTGKDDKEEEEGISALSSEVIRNLKQAYRKLDESADELSMVAETYENIGKLSSAQRLEFRKLASEAVRDADVATGEAATLIRLAERIHVEHGDAHDYVEDDSDMDDDVPEHHADDMDDDAMSTLVSAAMDLRRSRRNQLLKQAEDRVLAERRLAREAILKVAEEDEAYDSDDADEVLSDLMSHMAHDPMHHSDDANSPKHHEKVEDDAKSPMHGKMATASVKEALSEKFAQKKAEEEREAYRLKIRRAYDVGMEMQRKGLLPSTKTALDRQVDEIMAFDDRAFEAFKRSIANAKSVSNIKVASDLGGINVGVESDAPTSHDSGMMKADMLSKLWD